MEKKGTEALLFKAINAAVLAGKTIMSVYFGSFEVRLKPDDTPLTQADQQAHALITSALEQTTIPIISEEHMAAPYQERKNWERCWVVDPLDGTKEFISRNGEFTVNIALVEKGKPVLGVIYVPVSQTLYYAVVSEKKAYRLVLDAHKVSKAVLKKSEEIAPEKAVNSPIKVVASRSHLNKETEDHINNLEAKGHHVHIVSKGSSLKFCLLAEGNAHVYPRYAPTMEWDTAAGHAICNAVGIKVYQAETGNELRYNKEDLLNPYFLASTVS